MRVDFWYEFASTYSYPAAMRCAALAATAGVTLRWRPILLGPIFAEQGWRNSPFNLYPAKGRYMWRDLERICAARNLPFSRPDPFPQNSLLAARLALIVPEALRPDFSRAVFRAEYALRQPIAERVVLGEILQSLGLYAPDCFELAQTEAARARLKSENAEAV